MLRIYDLAAVLAAPRNISFKLRSKLSLQQLGPNLYRKWTFQAASQIYILLVQIMIQPAWMLKWWRRSDREATGFVQLYKGGLTGETRRGNVIYLDFLSFHCLKMKKINWNWYLPQGPLRCLHPCQESLHGLWWRWRWNWVEEKNCGQIRSSDFIQAENITVQLAPHFHPGAWRLMML